jgi:hypothetical protein
VDELVAPLSWAQRLKRVFNIDIALCPICGGTLRVIADITDPAVIQKTLDHIEAQPPLILTTNSVSRLDTPFVIRSLRHEMAASRPESFSQAVWACRSGDLRSFSAFKYLSSSYGVRVIQQR